jgi:hypothetical protein
MVGFKPKISVAGAVNADQTGHAMWANVELGNALMFDPRYGNIHLDANALEPPDPSDRELVREFLKLRDDEVISVVNPHGVQREVNHPHTPSSTRMGMEGIFTIQTSQMPEEQTVRSRLRELMRGGAAAGRHAADAEHIFEASKYGGIYFVTHDRRIINKKTEIAHILGSRPAIVTLRQFIKVCKDHHLA